jgi:GntR family transcriptional regulator
LYRQVRDALVQRIVDGRWQPGQALPSEPEIAGDLGVSQGTVRKALDEMTAENLVVRRQGRGTYVARHDEARILFQFFKLVRDDGERRFPESRVRAVRVAPADDDGAARLGLTAGAPVIAIERVRSLEAEPCIVEEVIVPHALFGGLEARELPNNLYELYGAEYGITVARAEERLKAVMAGPREVEALGVAPGAALLAIDRVAYALDGRAVERRLSLCRTERLHYLSDLR